MKGAIWKLGWNKRSPLEFLFRVSHTPAVVMQYVMQKRLIPALVLIIYGAILIKVVVFKGMTGRSGPPGQAPGIKADGSRPRMRPPGPPNPQNRHLLTRFAPRHANYVPFKTILPQLRGEPRWSFAIINLVGNTALFVPVGFLVPLVYRKMNWRKSLALAIAVGLAMEGMEGMFSVGIVDVDDVILNALGVMIGYCAFTFFERRRRDIAASRFVSERRA